MTDKSFMAFATGKESTEENQVKRYIGIAPVYILAVNPSKEELEKIYGITFEKDPEYVGKTEINGREFLQVRIDFIVETDPEKSNGIDFKTKVSFFVNNEYKYNKDRTKVQVINKYGETTWLSIENAKNKVIPDNLKWFEPADFRPALSGEAELTSFIKTYLNIPNKSYRDSNGNVVELPNKEDAEARLDNISSYIKGDFSELKDIIKLQPKNKIKCMFGVKTSDDNRLYQAVYTQKFLKNNVSNYSKLDEDLQDRKNAGAYPSTEFNVCPLKEYSIESTDFKTQNNDADMPDDSPWGIK